MNAATHDAGALPAKLFATDGLALPPVPAHLAASLEQRRGEVFSTRELAQSPYALPVFVSEVVEQADTPDYAVVAFDGHGVNSRAVHYYLVCGPLALFIQLPWGGAYTGTDAARAEIERMFDWAAMIQGKVDTALRLGRIEPGRRLVIVASRFSDAGWRWVAPGESAEARDNWNPAGGMMAAIEDMLDRLAAGAA